VEIDDFLILVFCAASSLLLPLCSSVMLGRGDSLNLQMISLPMLRSITCNRSNDYAVWLDMWTVNQHNSNDFSKSQNHDDVMAFQEVLQICLDGTLVDCGLKKCQTQSRAWCLFEWDWTIFCHGREKLKFTGLSQEEARAGKIDVEKAECFKAQNKAMIFTFRSLTSRDRHRSSTTSSGTSGLMSRSA
jgi:hypothetical protein